MLGSDRSIPRRPHRRPGGDYEALSQHSDACDAGTFFHLRLFAVRTGDYAPTAGSRGSTFTYSDPATGQVFLWRLDRPSSEDVTLLPVAASGPFLGDLMALSPDESKLALVRLQWSSSGLTQPEVDSSETRTYIVDLASNKTQRWQWLESTSGYLRVTALHWGDASDALYVSLGPAGGSQGERSFRYDLVTGRGVEIAGLACVMDVGPNGEVLGLPRSPAEFDYPAGSPHGEYPLGIWQDGIRIILPRGPRVVMQHSA